MKSISICVFQIDGAGTVVTVHYRFPNQDKYLNYTANTRAELDKAINNGGKDAIMDIMTGYINACWSEARTFKDNDRCAKLIEIGNILKNVDKVSLAGYKSAINRNAYKIEMVMPKAASTFSGWRDVVFALLRDCRPDPVTSVIPQFNHPVAHRVSA